MNTETKQMKCDLDTKITHTEKSTQEAIAEVHKVLEGKEADIEKIRLNPLASILYAREMLQDRFEQGEPTIALAGRELRREYAKVIGSLAKYDIKEKDGKYKISTKEVGQILINWSFIEPSNYTVDVTTAKK